MATGERIRAEESAHTRAKLVGGSCLLVFVVLMIALPSLFLHGILMQYGPGEDPFGFRAVGALAMWSVLCGIVSAVALRVLLASSGRRTSWMLLGGLVAVSLSVASLSMAAWLGTTGWERDQAVRASACTASEAAAVAEMAAYADEFNPAQGTSAGTCEGWIMLAGDDSGRTMDSLWADMASDGWTTSDDGPWERTWHRDQAHVRVWFIQSSEGSTGAGVEGLDG